ncbi:TRAP transporter small permease [Sporosarcina sp. FSL K6-1522]|uniref:TRAP transporter small permease n=1 Tax=Sporosarcina sp. FSL K6-1522 TaxID=2921554 RepID=UPI00315A8A72
MGIVEKWIGFLTIIGRWIAILTMTSMMVFTTYAVISRNLGAPVVGDVEFMQLGMVVLIMFALAYTQKRDAHISIGLFVDRLPKKIQEFADVISYLSTFIICLFIGWVSFNIGLNSMNGNVKTTDLLGIPHFPFRFIIALGFMMWGLEALLKSMRAFVTLFAGKEG